MVADQQFILYRRRIGLLERPSVVHFDDETAEMYREGVGIFAVSVCEEFKLELNGRIQAVERKSDRWREEELFCPERVKGGDREYLAALLRIPLRCEKIPYLPSRIALRKWKFNANAPGAQPLKSLAQHCSKRFRIGRE